MGVTARIRHALGIRIAEGRDAANLPRLGARGPLAGRIGHCRLWPGSGQRLLGAVPANWVRQLVWVFEVGVMRSGRGGVGAGTPELQGYPPGWEISRQQLVTPQQSRVE